MGAGSVGGASGATEVDDVNPGGISDGDSLGETAVDNVDGSGMSATYDESTDKLLYGSVVSSAPSEFQVKSDSDGNVVTVEQKVVVKTIASDGNFEDGTPVALTTSLDGFKILLLRKRSRSEKGIITSGTDGTMATKEADRERRAGSSSSRGTSTATPSLSKTRS